MDGGRSTRQTPGSEYPIPVGGVVRALRVARGLDQIPCADALGISQSQLSKIESGQKSLTVGPWVQGASALAIGTPPKPNASDRGFGAMEPAFVLAESQAGSIGSLHLLAGEDGRVPVFAFPRAVLFAMAVFEYACGVTSASNICALPVWSDFTACVARHGSGIIDVPSLAAQEGPDFFSEHRDELEAANTIARAWVGELRGSEAKAKAIAAEREEAVRADDRDASSHLQSRRASTTRHKRGSLVVFSPRGEEVLWPPTN